MTPYDAALLMMRRHADPDLIVAYLLEETRRAGRTNPLRLSQHPLDRTRFTWADITAPFQRLAAELDRIFAEPAARQSDYVLAAEGETPC